MKIPHVVILGGGPAGCGAAYYLHRHRKARVTVVERQAVVGGNAGSFPLNGQYVDYGSHRLHHACDPEILADIKRLLGDDLSERPRHGRIRLRGRWLHFPLLTKDLMMRLDRQFAFGVALDVMRRTIRRSSSVKETFESVLLADLGPTICHGFYFPYARKIWGLEPQALSAIQARKRVSAGSFGKLVKRLLAKPGGGKFYYPRRGYGQITEVFADSAVKDGAELALGWEATKLELPTKGGAWIVSVRSGERQRRLEADHVWSTLPITLVASMVHPAPSGEVLEAVRSIGYRAMLLVYLQLDVDQYSPTDAHYFPEANISMTRLSEPKNYFGSKEPAGRTILCAELPCDAGDELWEQSDSELGNLVVEDMARAGLGLERPPTGVTVKRLNQAYPIYTAGYDRPFRLLDDWAGSMPNFLTFGRQGLFAHDNTHHALLMASGAADCLHDGSFSDERWGDYRKIFASHVVED